MATVSRVLRGGPDVRAATRARVLDTISALDYRPSPLARALVSGRSRLLTLLVNDIANPFYPQLAKSVESAAKKEGYSVAICSTGDSTTETCRCIERLLTQGVDGVIHASVARDDEVLLSLIGDPARVVFTNRRPDRQDVSYVVSDNRAGAVHLTGHLLSLGHRRIGFIAGPPFASNAVERLDGFRDTMATVADGEPLLAYGDFSEESGSRAVLEWVRGGHPPTAVVAVNDASAFGALEALTHSGLRVPDDVAVAGFDGTHLSASPHISLTTVDQHIPQLARRAVQILLQQLRAPRDFRPVHEILTTELIVRRTTLSQRRSDDARSRHGSVRAFDRGREAERG